MKVKLEDIGDKRRLLMFEVNEPLEKHERAGEWGFVPGSAIQYGRNVFSGLYLSRWLWGDEAEYFFSLVDAFCKERRILIGERNGFNKMEFSIDFEPAEFHWI